MAEDPMEVLERQVRQLTREVADLTRQVEHEQKMCGFLEDRVQRLESTVHSKMSRVEVISWCWALLPGHVLKFARDRSCAHTEGLSYIGRCLPIASGTIDSSRSAPPQS